eukprot:3081922-Rhodomonas_salina.1
MTTAVPESVAKPFRVRCFEFSPQTAGPALVSVELTNERANRSAVVMPTAAQFKCQVHAKKKARPAWGDSAGGWIGGAWKTRYGHQKPTKGDSGFFC